MMKGAIILGLALLAVTAGTSVAYAGSGGEICFFWICIPIGGGGGGHPAPAPLLAAGIPAFMALGGGTLLARLRRKRQPQA